MKRAWIVCIMLLAAFWSAPAQAQDLNSTGSYRAELDRLVLEMRALWGELDRFQPKKRYCYPPNGPLKQPDEMLMTALSARVDELSKRYLATRSGLDNFLARNPRLYAELYVDGVDPRSDKWWTRYNASHQRMLGERDRKKALLDAAPEVHCTPPPTDQQPVADPPKPPPLPERPVYAPIAFPALPDFFCSWEEYWAFINDVINPLNEQAAENNVRAAEFRTAVEQVLNFYVQNELKPPAGLSPLRRQAIDDVAEQRRIAEEMEKLRARAKAIPVIDCRQPEPPPPPAADVRPPPEPAESILDEIEDGQQGTGQTPGGEAEPKAEARPEPPPEPVESILDEIEEPAPSARPGPAQPPAQGLSQQDEADIARALEDAPGIEKTVRDLEADDWGSCEVRANIARTTLIRLRLSRGFSKEAIDRWAARLERVLEECGDAAFDEDDEPPPPGIFTIPLKPVEQRLLDAHNKARAEVGVPPLSWDPNLAVGADEYARQLTTRGRVHAPREGRENVRENLLQSLRGGRTPEQMVGVWLAERQHFVPGTFPDVTRTGNWADIGHYTQVVWRKTTHVGCAIHRDARFDWLVCRYSPPGNQDGEPVF